jgi:hypothetical protein
VALARRLPAAQNDCGEVRWGIPIERHDKQSVTRVDFQHTASHLIFGRYMVTAHDQEVPYDLDASKNLLVSAGGGGVQPNGFSDRHHGVVAGNTWVINARTLNSIRFSYNRVTVNKSGAQFFDPGRRHQSMDVGRRHFIVAVPGYFNIGSGPTAKREMWRTVPISSDLNLVPGATSSRAAPGDAATWCRWRTRAAWAASTSPRRAARATPSATSCWGVWTTSGSRCRAP